MQPLIATDLWQWIEENRSSFDPPVGNKVIWEDSQFTAMVIKGPNRRRDFHEDPYDEIFWMLRGDMTLEHIDEAGKRQNAVIRQGEMLLCPANTRHSPHRPRDTWGLVIEIKRTQAASESLYWYCERCDTLLHKVTMNGLDIEAGLKDALNAFDASTALRTCKKCGHVQPEKAPEPQPPVAVPA
jgi:3-hydroxyanthranilate 3,4-dioxygenase